MSAQSTIVAIATGPAAGAIGIVRLSGPLALTAARAVAPGLEETPAPRTAVRTRFVDDAGTTLDDGLALFFPAPHSATGEDVVELHAHGSPRLLQLLLARLLQHEGVRLAHPGEFTRRGFVSGKLNLMQAEAVADLIAADSEGAVRAAAAQLSGGLTPALTSVRGPLLALHADVEAALDFPDEAEGVEAGFAARLEALDGAVARVVETARRGALVRRGAKVVLYGPPNAGKSTLFNALVGEARALVDEAPGTTRDAVEARLEWSGTAVTLVDTAGLDEAAGRVESMGVARTREVLAACDLAVLLVPPGATADAAAGWRAPVEDARRLEAVGKADLGRSTWNSALPVSGRTGEGVDELRKAVENRLGAGVAGAVAFSGERHLAQLERLATAVDRAHRALASSTLEVVAGELGLARAAVAELTGEDASEVLLDALFARFCIGK